MKLSLESVQRDIKDEQCRHYDQPYLGQYRASITMFQLDPDIEIMLDVENNFEQ